MSGISVDAHNQVWTFNRGEQPVQVYKADGTFVRAWGKGLVGKAHHLRFDPEGNVWLTDIGLHVVRKFTPEGELLLTLGTPGESGEDSTHFNMPTDLAITPRGDLFVADGYGNNRIVHFAPDGRFLKSWGKMGTSAGEFSLPHSIALDSAGRLYVADRNNARVQVFDQNGTYLDQWRNLCVPWHVWITSRDEVFVCGSSPDRWKMRLPVPGTMVGIPPRDQLVLQLTTSGRVQAIHFFPMGVEGQEKPGELNWVHALALDNEGSLYLGDIKGKRAQKFVHLESEAPVTVPPGELADGPPKADESVKPAAAIKP
jgi:streptogramin lyase